MTAAALVDEPTETRAPLLALTGISKSFPGVRALHNVSLTLRTGEVMGLIGENGAGKSTLVKIMTGIYRADAGEMTLDGAPVSFASPRAAWEKGVTAIHQETAMFDDLSVAENIFMGHAPLTPRGLVDWRAMRAKAAALLARLEARIDPDTLLKRLGVAQKHLVSIARVLSHGSRVIIMDEPTAALSAHEIDDLFRIIAQLKSEGHAIVFISHKFDEIFRVCDRWTCLRDGEHVGEGLVKDVKEAGLVRLMVGRPIDQVFPKRAIEAGAVALEVEDLSNASEFDGVSFSLRRGEILGLYGLVGAGRSEAMQGLFGLSRLTRGVVRIDGAAVTISTPGEAIAHGLAYVPEDRQIQGAVLPFGVRENMTLASLAAHARRTFLSKSRELGTSRKFGERLSVKAASWEQRLGDLSGGNQQKVVIAKWLATKPRILVLDEPTKGIDIGSKAAVHEFMSELAAEGLAVVLISSELPEVMGMADRILVMHEGRVAGEFMRGAWSAEAIVAAASASKATSSASKAAA